MESKPDRWFKINDTTTGRYFYANPSDGSCSWYPPSSDSIIIEDSLPTWWEMYDDQTNAVYYFNYETQETVWTLPEDIDVHPIPLSSYDDSMISNKLGEYKEINTEDEISNKETTSTDESNSTVTETNENDETKDLNSLENDTSNLDDEEMKIADKVINEHFEVHEDSRTGHKYYLHKKSRKLTWSKLEAYEAIMGLPEPPPPLDESIIAPLSKNSNIELDNINNNNNNNNNDNTKSSKLSTSHIKRKRASAFYHKDSNARDSVYGLLKDVAINEKEKSTLTQSKSETHIQESNQLSSEIPVYIEEDNENISQPSETSDDTLQQQETITEEIVPISKPPSKAPPVPPKKTPNIPPPVPKKTDFQTPPKIPPKVPLKKVSVKVPPPVPPKKMVINTPPPVPKKLSESHSGSSINRVKSHHFNTSLKFNYLQILPKQPASNSGTINFNERKSLAPSTVSNIKSSTLSEKDIYYRLSLESEATSPRKMPNELKKQINSFRLEGFAQQYFKNVRKGIFRRTVPVRELLVWSKDALKNALLNMNAKLEKKALSNFKNIQVFMGDRAPSNPNEERIKAAESIVTLGLKHPELRDEIFCQLCKQITVNPNVESLRNGWSLITLVLQYFPPTKDLEPWLVQFLKEHEVIDDEIVRKSVTYALKKIPIISRQGAVLRIPGIPEIELALKAAIKPTIFGTSLDVIMENEGPNEKVPRILTALINRLKDLNAHRIEGIFRISGSTIDCTNMRIQIENGDYDFSRYDDPHVPASVLKQWFRSLEEPVIPPDHYWKCIEAIKEDRMDLLNNVIKTLPEVNYNVLVSILRYLQLVAQPENQEYTKMGIQNLAIVFGPNFVRCPSPDPRVILDSQQWEQKFIVSLITHIKL